MASYNLQHWTRIGAMNPFLQRKPKRQRTGAVQDLAEARKHVGLACVLEYGSPLPLSDERFMESGTIRPLLIPSLGLKGQISKSRMRTASMKGRTEALTRSWSGCGR